MGKFKLVSKVGDYKCAGCGKALRGPAFGTNCPVYCSKKCSGPTDPWPAPFKKNRRT